MPETRVIDGALVTVRTARTRHRCGAPGGRGHSIEPGEQYEHWRVPPWRGGNESPRWWQGDRHVGAGDGRVCDEIEAYREKAAREQQATRLRSAVTHYGEQTWASRRAAVAWVTENAGGAR